jgi:CheY-like chemotaxis protein
MRPFLISIWQIYCLDAKVKMETNADTIVGKRILLVDDERVVREAVRCQLARDEYIVVEANNGAEAYSMFAKSKFDLVVTDCVMPFLNGDELAVRIRQLSPKQPILMMTGYDYRRGPRNPVNVVLHKPCDYTLLQKEIAKLL